MKKLYLTAIVCAVTAASALAQGTIIFDSSNGSSWVTLKTGPNPNEVSPTNLPAAGSWTAALLFAPGTTLGQPIGNFTQVSTTLGNAGYITGPTVLIGASTGTGEPGGAPGTFIVEGWTGNFANYAAAAAPGGAAFLGQSVEFVNGVGNPNPPATAPASMTGWDGGLILVSPVPEPTTIALGGLGAAAMLLFRRRKQ